MSKNPPSLSIATEKVYFIIIKARQFDVKDVVTDRMMHPMRRTIACYLSWQLQLRRPLSFTQAPVSYLSEPGQAGASDGRFVGARKAASTRVWVLPDFKSPGIVPWNCGVPRRVLAADVFEESVLAGD